MASNDTNMAIALEALIWVLQDETRSTRLLGLTGLTPEDMRARIDDPELLGAVLGYLEAHEPDLIACAHAIERNPAALLGAKAALAGD